MRGLRVLLLLASLPLACGKGLPDLLADCADATCRSDLVIAAFGRSAEEGAAAIDQLPDPLERIAVVSRLVEVYPGKTLGLCDKRTRGPPRRLPGEAGARGGAPRPATRTVPP